MLAYTGQSFAADRGHDRGGGGHDRGGGSHNHSSRGVSVGFGVSNFGSGFSFGFGNRFGGRFGYRSGPAFYSSYGSYCSPVRSYCGPTYFARPYCSPIVYGGYDTCYPSRTVIVDAPIYSAPIYSAPVYLAPSYASAPEVDREGVVQAPAPQTVVVQQSAAPQPAVSADVRPPVPNVRATEQASYRDRELGDAYLRMGDPDNAVRVYSKYLTAWNADGTAVRNLGFAQVERGDAQEGARAVIRGYQLEPQMLQRPLAPSDFGGIGPFQRTLDNATRAAAGNNTPEGWLTVAILQHATGQREQAVIALQKSRDAGLDKNLLDQFTLELSK
jgi:tetratricopeptide (TPR) repeat protein